MAYKRVLGVSLVITAMVGGGFGCDGGTGCSIRVRASINNGLYGGCQDNATNLGGTLSVASSGNNVVNLMDVNFGAAATIGTTTVGVGVSTSFQVETPSGAIWRATQAQGSGSLTIMSLTATGATGTFFFTAVPVSGGATGDMVAVGGTFDVTF